MRKTLWVEALDPRGRLFHRRTELEVDQGLWGMLPGTWIGFDTGHGIVPMRWPAVTPDGESPVFVHVPTARANGKGEVRGVSCYVELWREQRAAFEAADPHAVVRRHGPDEPCARCGGARGDHHWIVDARTVAEPMYCSECLTWFERRVAAEYVHFREMDCACGAWCYVQVSPTPTARGPRHDVLRCTGCKALKCATCLPEGEMTCRDCLTNRRAA